MTTSVLSGIFLATTVSLTGFIQAAEAGQVKVAGVTASSEYPADDAFSYEAKKIIDGKVSTAWVEGDQGSGLGAWIELDLGGEQTIQKVKVWGGMWYSSEYWNRANRPKQLELKFDDGSTEMMDLGDDMAVQEFNLSTPKKSAKLRVKIKAAHSGTTWLDTGISEVQVFSSEADGRAAGRSFTASSSLPADGDGNYEPKNIADGIADTMWCEASKDGDGAGEWLEVSFGGPTKVGKLHLINGVGTSFKYWMKANRVAKATLTWSDGSTQQVDVKNTALPQVIPVGPKTTSSVKVTFDEIKKGTEFNDLCVSEAWFSM